MIEDIIEFVINPKFYLPFIYIFIGIICYFFIKKIIITIFNKQYKLNLKNKKRYNTLLSLIIDMIRILVIVFVILSILSVYGVNVKGALAGLGIASVLVGLAFQDLFKDYIVGFSIIMEDYFSVGDIIEVNGFKGEVINIGLKSTRIKRYDGPVMVISNRNIDKVINYSNTFSLALIVVGVAYEEKIDRVEKVLLELFEELNGKIDNLLGPIEIWGVEELDNSSVNIKIAVKTEPMKHIDVQRRLRKEIKTAFDKAKVKIPYPQVEVHNGK